MSFFLPQGFGIPSERSHPGRSNQRWRYGLIRTQNTGVFNENGNLCFLTYSRDVVAKLAGNNSYPPFAPFCFITICASLVNGGPHHLCEVYRENYAEMSGPWRQKQLGGIYLKCISDAAHTASTKPQTLCILFQIFLLHATWKHVRCSTEQSSR